MDSNRYVTDIKTGERFRFQREVKVGKSLYKNLNKPDYVVRIDKSGEFFGLRVLDGGKQSVNY